MKQSPFPDETPQGLHVAIVMDEDYPEDRTWGLRQYWDDRHGPAFVSRVAEAATNLGIETLTLCSFPLGHWESSREDIGLSMERFLDNLCTELTPRADSNTRVRVIGRQDRLSPRVIDKIEALQYASKSKHSLTLCLAFDYSSREMLIEAVRHATIHTPPEKLACPDLGRSLGAVMGTGPSSPDVDLLIRTSGGHWLGDSLLWESAYAELFFTAKKWPEFTGKDLAEAIQEFHGRDRRFGNTVLAS